MDAGLFASGWDGDCEKPKKSKAGNTLNLGFLELFCYSCLRNKFEIESPKNDHFCSMQSDGSGRCQMDQLIGEFGHTGLFDLAV